MQVGAITLEELVRGQREENVEIAGWAAANASLSFAGKADAGAVFDALREY